MNKEEILNKVDHTLLAQTSTWEQIKVICDDGIKYNVASVCIPPCFVKKAKEYVGEILKICTVIGFPLGANSTKVKLFEAKKAIADGVDEIDVVMNIGKFKDKKYTYVSDDKGDITIYDKIPNNAETVAWFLAEKKDFEKVADDDIKNELLENIKELQKEYFVNFEDELSVYVEDCDFENSFYFREPSLICLQFNFELYKNDDINDDIYKEKLQQMLKKEYVSYFIDSVCGLQDSELRKGYTEAITYLMGVSPENYTSKLYSAISEIESKIDSEKDKEKLCELLISSLYMMTPESDESTCRMAIEILNSNTYDFDKSVISEAFKNAGIEWINIKEPEKEEPEKDRPDRGAAKPDREDNKTPWNRDNEEKFDDDDKR